MDMARKKVTGLTINELQIMKIIWDSPSSPAIQEMAAKLAEGGDSVTGAAVCFPQMNCAGHLAWWRCCWMAGTADGATGKLKALKKSFRN